MSRALVTSADLDDIEDLAHALQEIVDDVTIPLFADDYDPDRDEWQVRFVVERKEQTVWVTTRYLKQVGMFQRLLTA